MADKEELFRDGRGGQALKKAAHEHRMRLERLRADDPYDLRAVAGEALAERDVIRERLAACEAGRDDSERVEGAVRTPGQLWAQLLDAPMPKRMHMLEMAIRNTEGLRYCYQQGHKGRIEDLRYQLTHHQEQLSAVFGFDEPQSLHALTVATQALRNIMVAGIAERVEPMVEYAVAEPELPEFRQPEGLAAEKAKVAASLKEAGIDLGSMCGYQWRRGDDCRPQGHSCVLLNPLHSQAHVCEQCEASLSHVEAEKLAGAGQ